MGPRYTPLAIQNHGTQRERSPQNLGKVDDPQSVFIEEITQESGGTSLRLWPLKLADQKLQQRQILQLIETRLAIFCRKFLNLEKTLAILNTIPDHPRRE
ncbi:MAG: hypothetical protein ACJAVK_003065 [Akkermansiaceae bacterium]|jgi:hypothetical protein